MKLKLEEGPFWSLSKTSSNLYVFHSWLIAFAMTKSGQLSYDSSDQVFPTLVRELLHQE